MNYARGRLVVPALAPGKLGLRRHEFAAAEREGRAVVGPGLPAFCTDDGRFLSDDCLTMPVG